METNCQKCPCKNTNCSRHGNCCICKAFHHGMETPSLSACERLDEESLKNTSKE